MNWKKTLSLFAIATLIFVPGNAQIKELKKWLSTQQEKRQPLENLSFSKKALTKKQAKAISALLIADKQKNMLGQYDGQWDNRVLKYRDFEMPFYYSVFGEKPLDGRSLFISLHGGGGAPSEVNDQQYKNQQHLYDSVMQNLEGVYMALRAPTNTWDLWHQGHIDDFLNIIVQMATIKEEVNPNKVYILGYSAGGDGVFQLAPRMADRWAAAAMMAGHPGDASALGLYNLPFSLHMGGLDSAYDRNGKAAEWKIMLDSLAIKNKGHYVHDVQIHKEMGHWMQRRDSVALSWMKKFERNPIPQKVVWKQDNRQHASFYWLGTAEDNRKEYGLIKAEYVSGRNEINIIDNYSEAIQLFVNDDMLNLDESIVIKYKGDKIYRGKVQRSILNIYHSICTKGDQNLIFSGMLKVLNNKKVEQ